MKTTWKTERSYAAIISKRSLKSTLKIDNSHIESELKKLGFTKKQIAAAIVRNSHLINS